MYWYLNLIIVKYWNEDIVIESKDKENIQTEETPQEKDVKTINETINKIEERAAVYNDLEPKILEYCTEQDNLPILRSNIKWYNKIKDKVIRLLKTLFKTKDTKNQAN